MKQHEEIDVDLNGSGDGFVAAFAHVASAVGTVTMGFSTDPIARWFYPKSADYFRWFPKFARAFAGGAIANGSAYCTGIGRADV